MTAPHKLFQFTPLREGRHARPVFVVGNVQFQFTPLREGRLDDFFQFRQVSNFNSRPYVRGDHSIAGVVPSGNKFQFTPLREGRPYYCDDPTKYQ